MYRQAVLIKLGLFRLLTPLLIVCWVSLSEACYASRYSLRLPVPEEDFLLAFDQPSGRYLVLMRDSFHYLNRSDQKWEKAAYELNQLEASTDLNNIQVLNTPEKTFLAVISGGLLYELRGNSIVRIDKSFHHAATYGSVKWIMNDTILSYGGYGFWNFKPYIIYFSPSSLDWKMFDLKADLPRPKARYRYSGFYLPEKNEFYVLGGQTNRFVAREPYYSYFLYDIWKINLYKRKWVKLGSFNREFFYQEYVPFFVRQGKGYQLQNIYLNELDFEQNSMRRYRINKELGHNFVNHQLCFNPADDELIYVSGKDIDLARNEITISPFRSLLSGEWSEYWLYRNPWFYVRISLAALLMLALVAFVVMKARKYPSQKNKLAFDPKLGSLSYNGSNIFLDETEVKLLCELSKEGRFYNTIELFEIISSGNNSMEALKKQKNKIFHSINTKVRFVTKGEVDLFVTRKNPEDKRLVEVKINEGVLTIIR